jgi:GntR family transcriptional regulator, transcriptional repressor for pyruvate dehydrogenase complex
MQPQISEIPWEDVTAPLVRQFKQMIRDGTLTPGCRLPAERELSQSLGVNRASLRPALKVLQVVGVLSQRVGDATYLSSDARTFFREPLDFLILLSGVSDEELFGLRLLVEPELAAIAAKRASPQDRADLVAALEAMKRSQTRQDRITSDLAFHEVVFRAAGNRACLFILVVIQRAILQSMEDSASTMPIEDAIRLHLPVFRAIEKRDPVAARRTMARHLRISRDSVRPRVAATGRSGRWTSGKPAFAASTSRERKHKSG